MPVKVAQEHPGPFDKQTDLKDFCSSLFTEIDQGNIGCKTLYYQYRFEISVKYQLIIKFGKKIAQQNIKSMVGTISIKMKNVERIVKNAEYFVEYIVHS